MAILINLANEERLVEVGVVLFVVDTHVEVDDVTILNWSAVGNPVADDLVRRDAHALREPVVVQWAWVDLAVHACLENDSVDLVARHASAHEPRCNVQDLA